MLTTTRPFSCLTLTRPLFDDDIAVAATDPRQDYGIDPAEAASLPRAVPKRMREFAAGRAAARQAMSDLGADAAPILQGKDRAPIWPAGLTGSISHCKTACVAVTGRVRALGVDIEDALPLPKDAVPVVCSENERAWLALRDPIMSRVIFSAKEAAYKAQYDISRALFGFETFEMTVDGDRFTVTYQQDVAPFQTGDQLHGRFAVDRDHIVTAMTLRG